MFCFFRLNDDIKNKQQQKKTGTSLAFTLPLMGSLQEKLTVFTPIAIVIVLLGFTLYQRYSQTVYEVDDAFSLLEDEYEDVVVIPQQPAFCERTFCVFECL